MKSKFSCVTCIIHLVRVEKKVYAIFNNSSITLNIFVREMICWNPARELQHCKITIFSIFECVVCIIFSLNMPKIQLLVDFHMDMGK